MDGIGKREAGGAEGLFGPQDQGASSRSHQVRQVARPVEDAKDLDETRWPTVADQVSPDDELPHVAGKVVPLHTHLGWSARRLQS